MPENNNKIIKHTITRLLARREHSKSELIKKLHLREFDSEQIDEWVEKFSQHDIQSDTRFVEAFIRGKVNKGQGESRIRNELRQHDIDQRVINKAFKDSAIDWFELALAVFDKRFSDGVENEYKNKQKQQRFMLYRGFDHEQIRYVFESREK